MFPGRGQSFNGLKHLTEKVTAVASLTRVRVVVDHTMPVHPTAKVNNDQCLYTPSRLHLPSETS